jgi:hypothetical protein
MIREDDPAIIVVYIKQPNSPKSNTGNRGKVSLVEIVHLDISGALFLGLIAAKEGVICFWHRDCYR